jgi:hypothetical protein
MIIYASLLVEHVGEVLEVRLARREPDDSIPIIMR